LEQIREIINRFGNKFVSEVINRAADGQVVRVAHRFALIGIAGEIAVGAGILPWESGSAVNAAKRCFHDWLQARGGIGPAEVKDGISTVRAFLAAHGQSRFVAAWENQNTAHAIRAIAGFRRQTDDAWDFYVTSTAWRDEVCRGFDSQLVAKALADEGWMVPPDTGNHRTCQVRVPGHGRLRLYHITSKILEAE
jgi:uncharacterized protein (DUF927 family)